MIESKFKRQRKGSMRNPEADAGAGLSQPPSRFVACEVGCLGGCAAGCAALLSGNLFAFTFAPHHIITPLVAYPTFAFSTIFGAPQRVTSLSTSLSISQKSKVLDPYVGTHSTPLWSEYLPSHHPPPLPFTPTAHPPLATITISRSHTLA